MTNAIIIELLLGVQKRFIMVLSRVISSKSNPIEYPTDQQIQKEKAKGIKISQ